MQFKDDMKPLLLFTLFSILSVLANSEAVPKTVSATRVSDCTFSGEERIRKYFESNEITPYQVINNLDDIGSEASWTSTTKLGRHTIEWKKTGNHRDVEVSLKINGDSLQLINKRSINSAVDDQPVDFSVVGEWEQMKLYNLNGNDIIGITLGPSMCTGLMCGVAAQIIYDTKTKAKTFFGTFRTDREVRLFRFAGGTDTYYVSQNFSGDPHGETEPEVVTFELYKLEKNGKIVVQKNSTGDRYFLKHTRFPDLKLEGGKLTQKKTTTNDKFEENWIEKIE